MPFEQVSLEDFDRAVANARSTAAFKRQIARFAPTRDQHCFDTATHCWKPGTSERPATAR